VEAHASSLSLLAGCPSIEGVLPGALWHRLREQNLLEQLAELDQSFEHGRQLMAAFLREQTLREVAAEVDAFAPDLATLGWTLDDLLAWARLP
jgi:hypothetical protein